MNQKGPSNKKKGRSKKAHVLSAAVQKATENFIERGKEISSDNPEMRAELEAAVDEVCKTGNQVLQILLYLSVFFEILYGCLLRSA